MSFDLFDVFDIRDNHDPYGQPILGQVVSFAGTKVTVDINGQLVTMPRVRSYSSPIVDDVVLVLRAQSALYCLGALNASPGPPPPPPPPPPPVNVDNTQTWKPLYTDAFNVTADVWLSEYTSTGDDRPSQGIAYGQNYFGCAFYGSGPSSVAAVAVSGQLSMVAERITSGTQPTMRLLTAKTRPAGMPSVEATIAGPTLTTVRQRTYWELPTAWVQALLDGTAGGIGMYVPAGSPNFIFSGRANDGLAFDLTLTWKDT